MSNMTYCRFQNTLQDLRDCYNVLDETDDLSDEERLARIKLIKLCQRITNESTEED